MTRPPNARGQGRKPIDKGGELMRSRPVRMTDAQWEKCKRLGGAQWLRDRIDRAKIPAQGGGEGGIRTHVTTKS